MDFFEAVEKRHSYRGPFKNVTVSGKDIVRIVESGLKAPSGKNGQTTTFVIVDEPGLVKKIGQMHPVNKAMQQAKVFIACVVDKNPESVYEGCSFQIEDCSAAVQNMLLSITVLGYASVWIDGWLRVEGRAQVIDKLLGIPEEKTIRVLLPIGVPAEDVCPKEKKPFEQRAWFNKFGVL
ncbi:MAG: nitroreductase family protein [Candidatus Theseobacter exili]|nr:nitroreductase family protein [Candidatus Theseobacter exili]